MCHTCRRTAVLLEARIAALQQELAHVRRLIQDVVRQWDADLDHGLTLDVSVIQHSHVAALRQWLEGQ
jgi:hypothetical protein